MSFYLAKNYLYTMIEDDVTNKYVFDLLKWALFPKIVQISSCVGGVLNGAERYVWVMLGN
jgi:hypothetical protein